MREASGCGLIAFSWNVDKQSIIDEISIGFVM